MMLRYALPIGKYERTFHVESIFESVVVNSAKQVMRKN